MARTRLAMIGLGMVSGIHATSLAELVDKAEFVAGFSPSALRRAEFAAKHRLPVVDDIEAIWNDPSIDAVIVLTPPNVHLEMVSSAAQVGKHVLLEKPLDISPQRSTRLVETAEAAGIKLGIVLQHRFRPISLALAGMMKEGRLGELVAASARLMNWRDQTYYDQPGRGTRARDGGGVLLTQGIHTLDLMISLVGLPTEVSGFAATSPVHRMETEDVAAGAMRFANGALGTIFATTTAYPGIADAIDVIGTKGSARIDGTRLIADLRDGSEIRLEDGSVGGGSGADPMAFSHQHHRAAISDFLDAIEHDHQPKVTGRDALRAHRLIEALLAASQTGQRQTVPAVML